MNAAVNLFFNPSGRWQKLAVVLFHLLALALTSRLAHWPYLLVLVTLLAIALPFFIYSRLSFDISRFTFCSLRSLFVLYTVTALRLALALVARLTCPVCSTALAVPEPFAAWLSFEWAAIFSITTIIVFEAARAFPARYHARLAAFGLTSIAFLWLIFLFPRLIPAGVTGADPFAYVQMGLDLATRGTPRHHFPLADLARDLNIPIYPTLFVGYTIPRGGDAATLWPPGFSAFLALAFTLFGEGGLYWLNPFIGFLCLIATFLLGRRVFNLPPFFALLAACLLLTSYEQTVRLSIPLADLATQLFTTLAIIIASRDRGQETRDWKFGIWVLALGISSGLAFLTRYTQLLLLPGLLFLLIFHHSLRLPLVIYRFFIVYCSLFIVSFFLTALPDFYYRTLAFGSPFSFAAGELAQFSAADIVPVASHFFTELVADFNLTTPLALIGAIYLLRYYRSTALGLILTLGPVVLFHLPYHYLKLRDLLFLFPILCALAVFGLWQIADGLSQIAKESHPLRFTFYVLLFTLLAFRWNAQRAFLSGYYTYGFLTAEQRAQVDSIADLTEPNAVIAGSLNSGAVSLYSRRDTVRPGHLLQPGRTWTESEFEQFVVALRAAGRPMYLLMDSEEMSDPAQALERCCHLSPIAELYLPYYYRSGAASNELIELYRVGFK